MLALVKGEPVLGSMCMLDSLDYCKYNIKGGNKESQSKG